MRNMKFTVKQNYCNCHPETCACNDWVVYDGDKKYRRVSGLQTKQKLVEFFAEKV